MARGPLTIKALCQAYAEGSIKGGTAAKLMQLPYGPTAITMVLEEAIRLQYIEHSGDHYRGWLTRSGISLLADDDRKRYVAAIKRRGAWLGA